MNNKPLWLASLFLTLAGCVRVAPLETLSSQDPLAPPDSQVTTREQAHEPLQALFAASDEQQLANDPLGALGRGDLRYAASFGDYITHDYFRTIEKQARENLEHLSTIDRDSLSAPDRISLDVFRYKQAMILRGFDSGTTGIQRQLPLDQLFGYHVTFPDMSSGDTIAPFNTLQDYENGLTRLQGFATYLHNAEEAMRDGIRAGHVQPRFVTVKVIKQLQVSVAKGASESPLVAPTKNFPPEIATEDAERLTRAYRKAVAETVLPAYRKLTEFMETVYLPASRTGAPGLAGMRDGEAMYRFLVEQHTGTTLSADAIHQIGLEEVARIKGEMEAIMGEVGFEGGLQDFFTFLRSDPQFKFATKESFLAGYEEIRQRLEPALPRLFATLPRTAFEVRAVPESLEKTTAGAYYNPGTPDGSRPGVFYVNTYDLPSRTRPTMETLFLHEAVPGHHFQASLAQENESLPPFLRFGWDTAFGEGWGLYAESLGRELGLFEDPYQRFGHLDLEMFRALRLVVDTGLHAKGWSRQQAVDLMQAHSSLGESALIADVDRYVVWPGQALAYKLGQIAIRNLRTEAERALGEGFELPAFHDQILGSGAVPIPILEAKVRAWIQERKERDDA